uniref:Uncharacterized protein n=1 Tax=Scleropages formosus TaxID=113540 RepID=A0A8C9UYJ0_SCLFO
MKFKCLANTYEWSPWTPPSTWADTVLFSNFSSPEYIMELNIAEPKVTHCGNSPLHMHSTHSILTARWTGSWPQYPGSRAGFHSASDYCCSSPWHPKNPYLDTSSVAHHQRKSTHQELLWWQPAMSPSSLWSRIKTKHDHSMPKTCVPKAHPFDETL